MASYRGLKRVKAKRGDERRPFELLGSDELASPTLGLDREAEGAGRPSALNLTASVGFVQVMVTVPPRTRVTTEGSALRFAGWRGP